MTNGKVRTTVNGKVLAGVVLCAVSGIWLLVMSAGERGRNPRVSAAEVFDKMTGLISWNGADRHLSQEQYNKLNEAVGTIVDVRLLCGVVYEAEKRINQLQEVSPAQDVSDVTAREDFEAELYDCVEMSALYRLAEIQSPESAEKLVSLAMDPYFGWDAARSEGVMDAITKCGKKALPFLRDAKGTGKGYFINECIEMIDKGETVFP